MPLCDYCDQMAFEPCSGDVLAARICNRPNEHNSKARLVAWKDYETYGVGAYSDKQDFLKAAERIRTEAAYLMSLAEKLEQIASDHV